MKQDLNQLKNMFVQLVQTNDLTMPQILDSELELLPSNSFPTQSVSAVRPRQTTDLSGPEQPIIYTGPKEEFDAVEVLEEHLSLHDMEKDMILKALKKFNGKRKDAAEELGISERTLYRKIKQFNIDI